MTDLLDADETRAGRPSAASARDAAVRAHAILEAVGFAAKSFLHAGSWENVIDEALARLGQAAGASRAMLYESRADGTGELHVDLRSEWAAPGFAPHLGSPAFSGFSREPERYGAIAASLAKGEPFWSLVQASPEASRLPEPVRATLAEAGTQSILLVPIPVDGAWWGTLGLDDSIEARIWSETEVEALRAAAEMLGAAVERRRMTEALERRDAILEAAAFTSECFLHDRSWETAIAQVLPRLGRGAAVSRVYIFTNRRADTGELLMSARHRVDRRAQPTSYRRSGTRGHPPVSSLGGAAEQGRDRRRAHTRPSAGTPVDHRRHRRVVDADRADRRRGRMDR